MKIHLPSILLCVSVILSSCSGKYMTDDEENIAEAADSFAAGYFNFDLAKAKRFSTPESEKWLRFRATNVLQEDIDILKQQTECAKSSVSSINIIDDTTALAVCKVENYLRIDTLGRAGCMAKSGSYTLKAVKRTDRWLIKMEDLPQSGKRSRD